ncbi:MAG: DUF3037 domain-containing protein [Acidobacteriaceae bacterium]
MTDRLPCEFFLVRYVPDPVKNEFVNIGVLLRPAGDGAGAPELRLTRDWSRVRCIDPDADTEMLEALETEMRQWLAGHDADLKPLMTVIEDSFSHLLQLTEPRGCLVENLAAGMEEMMRLYVEPRKARGRATLTGRAALLRSMRTHFEQAHVWDLMRRRIAASAYTQPGDPLKLDCGYRPNGLIRVFHAVSLEADAELAKVLAFSAPALRAGVARVENAELELTAIVEPLRNGEGEVPDDEDQVARYRFGVEAMEAQQIRVLTASDLERVAETARRELRV